MQKEIISKYKKIENKSFCRKIIFEPKPKNKITEQNSGLIKYKTLE